MSLRSSWFFIVDILLLLVEIEKNKYLIIFCLLSILFFNIPGNPKVIKLTLLFDKTKNITNAKKRLPFSFKALQRMSWLKRDIVKVLFLL